MRLTEHADVSSDATCKEALPQTGREGLLFFYFSFCAVARWDATFWAFRGIGEGGLRLPGGFFAGTGVPAWPDMRGGASPHPLHSTLDAGAPPCTRGNFAGAGGPCTHRCGRSARAWPCHARHPGDFRFTTKVTKGVPGALPLDPAGGHYHPPSSAPRCSPQKGEGATKGSWICHFEVVRAIGISFSRSSVEETPAAFKPWRGDYRCRMCRLCRFCVKFVSGNLA